MASAEWDALRKKRGAPPLSEKQRKLVEQYVSKTPYQEIDDLAKTPANEMVNSLFGQGKFRDTGREAEGIGEGIDSYLGAPARVAIDRLQGGDLKAALVDALVQAGRDPRTAPTGVDIASKATDNPYIGAGLATAVDLGAQIPLPFSPGVAGKVKDVVPEAEAVLSRIKTPEQAVALKGAEREQYLKALDEVYGDRAKRAKDMGFGDKTWYHGTKSNIEAFDNSRLGTSTKANSARKAHFFAEKPELAADYAELAPTKTKVVIDHPSYRKAEDDLRQAVKSGNKTDIQFATKQLNQIIDDLNTEGENVLPVRLALDNPLEHDFKGANYRERSFADLLKQAKEDGRPGALLKNAIDAVYYKNENPQDIATVFDPKNIRSVNAAFDPRFKDSDLLLAGKAGVNPSDLPSPLISAIRQKREEKNRNK